MWHFICTKLSQCDFVWPILYPWFSLEIFCAVPTIVAYLVLLSPSFWWCDFLFFISSLPKNKRKIIPIVRINENGEQNKKSYFNFSRMLLKNSFVVVVVCYYTYIPIINHFPIILVLSLCEKKHRELIVLRDARWFIWKS